MIRAWKALATSLRRRAWQRAHRRDFVNARGPRPRVLLDLSVLARHDAGTGIQRVVRAIAHELMARSGECFDVVPIAAGDGHGFKIITSAVLERGAALRLGRAAAASRDDVFLGLDLNARLLPTTTRQVEAWRAAGAKVAVVIYDLLPVRHPQWFLSRTTRRFRSWLSFLSCHADILLGISDHVLWDIKRYFGPRLHCRLGRLHLANDLGTSLPSRGIKPADQAVLDHTKRHPTLLMVGTIEPRKGYDVALAALQHLWAELGNEAPSLVIVGQKGWRTGALQKLISEHPLRGKQLFWLEDISDEALALFYSSCKGLLMTSHAEGFGLPPSEAAAHGLPALVRDLPVLREQRLPNCTYFLDDQPAALGAAIKRLLEEPRLRSPHLGCSWRQSVEELLQELELPTAMRSQAKNRSSRLALERMQTTERVEHS